MSCAKSVCEGDLPRHVGRAQAGPPRGTLERPIHVATAAALGEDLVAVVTYDKQMVRAVDHLGLPVVSPGAPVES